MGFRSGYVTIIGRPNVGKSTLLNRMLGEKIAIVSKKPQTTRNRILGIHHTDDAQLIFLDTPGVHKGRDTLNKRMVAAALATLEDASVILMVVDGSGPPGGGDRYIAEQVVGQGKPVVLAVNKCDRVPPDRIPEAVEPYRALAEFTEFLPVSALEGTGVDDLLERLLTHLPEGPAYFPADMITDLPERFLVAEIVREKCYELLRDEVPYGVAVVIEAWEESDQRVDIAANILVERESMKGIVIGKKGSKLKEIGTRARKDIERLLATHVFLKLFVKVKEGWSKDPATLRELGYD